MRAGWRTALVCSSVLPLLGACQPLHCTEAYSPLVKLLVGAPIPVLITMAIVLGLTSTIDAALGRAKRWRFAPAIAVGLTCVLLPSLALLPHGFVNIGLLLSSAFGLALVAVVALVLRNPSDDPNQHSFSHALSGALEPGVGSRLFAGLLVVLLVVVTILGVSATVLSVDMAGRDCSVPRPPPARTVTDD